MFELLSAWFSKPALLWPAVQHTKGSVLISAAWWIFWKRSMKWKWSTILHPKFSLSFAAFRYYKTVVTCHFRSLESHDFMKSSRDQKQTTLCCFPLERKEILSLTYKGTTEREHLSPHDCVYKHRSVGLSTWSYLLTESAMRAEDTVVGKVVSYFLFTHPLTHQSIVLWDKSSDFEPPPRFLSASFADSPSF